MREAKELQEQDFKPPKQKITDQAELDTYRLRKRKEFEDLVRRVRWNQSVWIKVLPQYVCRESFVLRCCVSSVAMASLALTHVHSFSLAGHLVKVAFLLAEAKRRPHQLQGICLN